VEEATDNDTESMQGGDDGEGEWVAQHDYTARDADQVQCSLLNSILLLLNSI
jgi:hypothetical protein